MQTLHLPPGFLVDILATFAFGFVAIILIVIGYMVFDKLTPKLDFSDQLNKGNLALAVVVGAFILGVCHVIARVLSAVLGGGPG
jgi:uncharacterized membrane protein YjfL (UPF0719 family)